ncbi:hypothetical protein K458DRAFT_417243 [Lentithecium fluviatile CBS 122367]|uniref:Uncharacterized protein n=1 Tax=Lentithecium fluviatile CBS 122367 TaxID=1168545 RepID=A0A6G1J3S3_9PLEO|nr:hypothetical protein K458DRAFT_417243 [Lentithecium fluviatile CBS 122367]
MWAYEHGSSVFSAMLAFKASSHPNSKRPRGSKTEIGGRKEMIKVLMIGSLLLCSSSCHMLTNQPRNEGRRK